MGKMLRVMVILVFLLSAGALALGSMLFMKRELLKGRTQKLETTLIAIGATIEAEAAEPKQATTFPARDIAPCTAEEIENPDRSAFWQNYKFQLEDADFAVMDLNKRKYELMAYYKRDGMGNIERDPVTGLKITEGEETMHAVLMDLRKKAEEQLSRLGDTRAELRTVREELVDTITELNDKKKILRSKLKYIVELEAQIAALKQKVQELEGKIATLEDEKRSLESRIEDLNAQITTLNDQITEKDGEIQKLKEDNDRMRKIISGPKRPDERGGTGGGFQNQATGNAVSTPGVKGKVVVADNEWRFCVIQLDEAFINEVMGDADVVEMPRLELHLRRPGESKQYVTKILLRQIRRADKLGVADILGDWQQLPVKVDDVCFF